MQRYDGVFGGGGKLRVVLHVANDGRRWRRMEKLSVLISIERKGNGGKRRNSTGWRLMMARGRCWLASMEAEVIDKGWWKDD